MRFIALILSGLIAILALSGCISKKEESSSSSQGMPENTAVPMSIEIYQYKPEIKDELQRAINEYMKDRPNIIINLETIGGGDSYEKALELKTKSENPPEIFNIGGMTDTEKWRDSLEDFADEEWVKNALPDVLRGVEQGGGIYGMPYGIEGYGIVCNKVMFEKAEIDIEGAKTFDELSDAFQKLSKKIAQGEMKDEFPNLEAVFELPAEETWVTGMHTTNIALAMELESQEKVYESKEIELKYADALKELFDMQAKYTSNANSTKKLTSVDYKTQVAGGIAVERVAAIQQGNWIYGEVENTDPKVAQKLIMIPIPLKGDEGDARLSVGVPMYWAVNKKSTDEEKKAAKDFLNWLYQSEEGKEHINKNFGFIAPFTNFSTLEPTDPLTLSVRKYMDEGNTLPFVFGSYPDYWGRDIFGEEVKKYFSKEVTWEELIEKVKNKWSEMR